MTSGFLLTLLGQRHKKYWWLCLSSKCLNSSHSQNHAIKEVYRSLWLSDWHLTKIKHKEESQLCWWSSCFSYKYKDVHRGDGQVHQPSKNKISPESTDLCFLWQSYCFLKATAFRITEGRFCFSCITRRFCCWLVIHLEGNGQLVSFGTLEVLPLHIQI